MAAVTRMRVGLAIGQLTYGGAEGQLYELARGLAAQCDVRVYCLSAQTEPYASRLAEAGIPVEVLVARRNLDPSRVLDLRRRLRRDRIDVVHAFLFNASAYAYLATRAASGIRLVTSARNCKLEASLLRRRILRAAFRASDAVICNSEEMARFAEEHYGAPASRTVVVYNGVDLTRFVSSGEASGPLTIGTIGRLERQKNLDAFLEAAAKVAAARPDARFEIVGQGTQRARLEARAADLGLGRAVVFRGAVADIPAFLARIDQLWLTSDWEGTPNVVLEAMAAGVPVVATRVGGTPEVVTHGVTGLLVEPGDAQAVADAALQVAGDRDLEARLATGARAEAEKRFCLSTMVSETLRIYARTLGERS